MTNTTTTADKGEQECREAFEQWFASVDNRPFAFERLLDDSRYESYEVEWAYRGFKQNRHPTNEGQDTLTDSEILTDAHRYCCKYVHADDAPYRFTERGIIEFVNLRIAHHLSKKQEKE